MKSAVLTFLFSLSVSFIHAVEKPLIVSYLGTNSSPGPCCYGGAPLFVGKFKIHGKGKESPQSKIIHVVFTILQADPWPENHEADWEISEVPLTTGKTYKITVSRNNHFSRTAFYPASDIAAFDKVSLYYLDTIEEVK